MGNELAQVELYTDGHALPTGADVRVAADDGKPVSFRLLSVGPGDRVRIAFALAKNVKRYAVYFGHPTPPPPPPAMGDMVTSGLLMETKVWGGGSARTFEQLQRSWDRSGPSLGQTLVPHPFHGFNPFDDHAQYVSRLTGTLYAPLDGDYTLAMAVDDEGGIFVDGQPTLLAHLGGADTRYHTTLHLTPGPHSFTLIHVNAAGSGYFSVGWKGPDTTKVSVIPRQSFGNLFADANVTVGPLEIKGKTLVGDFAAERVSECFVGGTDDYAFHYKFTSLAKVAVPVRCSWDFGDGQHAVAPTVDHAYLRDGVYTVRCTARAGANVDEQTCRLVVGRDYLHLTAARLEPAEPLSAVVAKYDVSALPPDDLVRAVRLHVTAKQVVAAVAAAATLASLPSPPPDTATTLTSVEQALLAANRPEAAVALWDRVPAASDVRPVAARHAATLALWWTGNAARAVTLLAPHKDDADVRLAYAHALLLSGKSDDARAVLESTKAKATGARRAALSGADARTVEFYITEGEPDAGDAAWGRWMTEFPTDYVTGYSVLLRTRLMELRHRDAAAAAVAEAFADAVPQSSYAPQLLDRAAKLVAKTDPAKGAALRQRLKQKYPEDPLSQD